MTRLRRFSKEKTLTFDARIQPGQSFTPSYTVTPVQTIDVSMTQLSSIVTLSHKYEPLITTFLPERDKDHQWKNDKSQYFILSEMQFSVCFSTCIII